MKEISELAGISGSDQKLTEEIEKKIIAIEKEIDKEVLKSFLGGKYDKNNAILEIIAGAGGQDSQDWATMLLRMYERYCQRKKFKTEILSQSFGEGGGPEGRIGTKQASLEIKGKNVYGFLKGEKGVHRLVRISPFSSQKLRHTSFAFVEVLPVIPEVSSLEIKPDEVKLEVFRSSGPGGQNVNKRETAVRLTHLPTGLITACQTERSQLENRQRAMKILVSKVWQLKEEGRESEIKKIKGQATSISWGNQIRSYVLHPYKLVKDLRTGLESRSPEAVLDGDLDDFIEAEIKL